MTRADHNSDPSYLLGYARLMLAQARRARTKRVRATWQTAARNARCRAFALSGKPDQGELW